MILIGICGASGSGKTTLAENLKKNLGDKCVILQQDSYYKNHADIPFEERKLINYDEPEAFDHAELARDLELMQQGKPIKRKAYDYTQHLRADTDELIYPADVLILEGIHCFYDPMVRKLLNFKIYVQVDPDICLLRRIMRDMKERGRDIDGIRLQYENTVRPMYIRYIRGYSEYADIIVSGVERNYRIVDMLVTYIENGKI